MRTPDICTSSPVARALIPPNIPSFGDLDPKSIPSGIEVGLREVAGLTRVAHIIITLCGLRKHPSYGTEWYLSYLRLSLQGLPVCAGREILTRESDRRKSS
ncbi:hypothetical protein DPEC_G00077530 [Dallia pectoralis]|uniref:Uncharacterized protein n=1 Tax=Dallia pectoralis TaxID=75939 RepID=A0ACC2H4I7_DALPE|nr:hypothetical protein DPEC_G00077530 [Dallia pectoralis]